MSEELNEKETLETTTTEVANTDNVEETVVETETEDVEKLKEQNKRLFERAKKAEAEAKELKKKPESSTTNSSSAEVDPVEVASLANALQGLTQDEIDFAKTIAAGSKTSLLKALQSEGFKAYHSQIVAEERKKKAALGGSKGSSQEQQKSLSDMSREDHQKVAMEAAKNIQ